MNKTIITALALSLALGVTAAEARNFGPQHFEYEQQHQWRDQMARQDDHRPDRAVIRPVPMQFTATDGAGISHFQAAPPRPIIARPAAAFPATR